MKLFRRSSVAQVFAGLALTLVTACGGADDDAAGATDSTTTAAPAQNTMGGTIVLPGTGGGTANTNTNSGASTSTTGAAPSNNAAPAPAPSAANDPAPASNPAPAPAADPAPAASPVSDPAPAPVAAVATMPANLYVPPECGADCKAHDIPAVIWRMSKKYNIPRWFYYSIIHRESSFDRCKTQPENADSRDYGRGLTQVTWGWYAGVPYPQHLASPDNNNSTWRQNMGIGGSFGAWIDMNDVTAIPSTPASESDCRSNPKSDDAYDPTTNLDRFSSGFAAPAYHLYHSAGESPTETLRKVAYHWHYGLWNSWTGAYPSDPRPYLSGTYGYDAYVNEYKSVVEADDGVWNGPTCKAPYSASGC